MLLDQAGVERCAELEDRGARLLDLAQVLLPAGEAVTHGGETSGNSVSPRAGQVAQGRFKDEDRPSEGRRRPIASIHPVLRVAGQLPRLAVITGWEVGAPTRCDSAVTAKTANPEMARSRGTTATALPDGVKVPTATGLLSAMSHSS
jgi:hypothetical protein